MKRKNKLSNRVLHDRVGSLLHACEATGHFPFNSRHFYRVGEWEIAFNGIYRFVEGNAAFKAELGPLYLSVLDELEPCLNRDRLPILSWDQRD